MSWLPGSQLEPTFTNRFLSQVQSDLDLGMNSSSVTALFCDHHLVLCHREVCKLSGHQFPHL